MKKIVYTKDMIDQIGNELIRRRDIDDRDGAPLNRDEINCMLSGVYAVLCSTADNLSDAYRFLDQYEQDLIDA